jgi:aryl-alcohol dehydrogenase-like predicted oxidoreductase
VPFATRVAMARYAMERCGWFHTSHKYGSTLDVLAQAFKEAPSRKPMCIFKLSGDSIGEVRAQIDRQRRALDMDRLDIGQIHLGGPLAEDVMAGGESLDEFRKLKAEGLVGALSLEIHPWTSRIALAHLKTGKGRDILEGCSFYFNPLQRYALNELYALIQKEHRPILSIRTMAGGPVARHAARPASPDDFMQARATALLPLYEQAGYENWTDFSMNFIFSEPGAICTIGSCSTPAHLDDYLAVVAKPRRPFPPALHEAIRDLQAKWSDEKDAFAPDWSM